MQRIAAIILTSLTLIPVCGAASSSSSAPPDLLPFTILPEKVAFFRPGPFTAQNVPLIRPTLQKIADAKPRGLILDLRNNDGGTPDGVQALLEGLLRKGTPYMRFYTSNVRRLAVTAQMPVFKGSTPVVVLRDERTVNEPDIAIYALQKIRKAGVVEFSSGRAALKRAFKQNARMNDYRPIKEAIFFVTPDVRLIADEGASDGDVIPRAVSFIRELSPFDEPKTTWQR
ncbi:hypothetical protein EXS70_01735 [Candidatus Peribacteria bacterium]|nr:hypothetical protein [Candidatus Peribacteria bacterium]